MSGLRLSVVVPSYEGASRVKRLLDLFRAQTLPTSAFEVIVVDDGSERALNEVIEARTYPFAVTLLRQANAGAAAARHLGALQARADVLIFVDDDMVVGPGFLAAHLRHHDERAGLVVLGWMRGEVEDWGLMERWHQHHLDKKSEALSSGAPIRGNSLFSGNVSLRREDYLAVGGFDRSLRRGHDAELGLRLEKHGACFRFSKHAWSLHGMDRQPLTWWRARAVLYGRVDLRIAKKHPDLRHASPWRWLRQMNPVARPFIELSLRWPQRAERVGGGLLQLAEALDRVKVRGPALKAVTLAYTVDYFRGAVEEAGSPKAALGLARDYLAGVVARRASGAAPAASTSPSTRAGEPLAVRLQVSA